jgi:hypothetical protein
MDLVVATVQSKEFPLDSHLSMRKKVNFKKSYRLFVRVDFDYDFSLQSSNWLTISRLRFPISTTANIRPTKRSRNEPTALAESPMVDQFEKAAMWREGVFAVTSSERVGRTSVDDCDESFNNT